MKKAMLVAILIALCAGIVGCGETVSGIGKDANRMGKGVNTFFFR